MFYDNCNKVQLFLLVSFLHTCQRCERLSSDNTIVGLFTVRVIGLMQLASTVIQFLRAKITQCI